jgi:ferredoxin
LDFLRTTIAVRLLLLRLESNKVKQIIWLFIAQIVMTVQVLFLPDNVTVDAQVGEPLLEIAQRAGLSIPTGCLMGSCHACEVTVEEFGDICSCITGVPPGFPRLTIQLFSDPTW